MTTIVPPESLVITLPKELEINPPTIIPIPEINSPKATNELITSGKGILQNLNPEVNLSGGRGNFP